MKKFLATAAVLGSLVGTAHAGINDPLPPLTANTLVGYDQAYLLLNACQRTTYPPSVTPTEDYLAGLVIFNMKMKDSMANVKAEIDAKHFDADTAKSTWAAAVDHFNTVVLPKYQADNPDTQWDYCLQLAQKLAHHDAPPAVDMP